VSRRICRYLLRVISAKPASDLRGTVDRAPARLVEPPAARPLAPAVRVEG
jgi:hypothetical protein